MKAFTERRPKLIGAVALLVMAVVVGAVVFANGSVFQSGYQVSARFPNAAGIGKGAAVLLAGVHVGSVDSVTLAGNAVDVTMTIHDGVVLPRHTAADIQVETLLGVVDVTLDPVSGWGHPLRNGAYLTDTSVPTEFYQLNNVAGHLLQRSDATALNNMVESLANITKGKQQQVAQIIEGLGKLTTTVSDRSAQVSQLIDSSNSLAGVLAQHDQQLATAISQLNTVASGLASHSSALASLIDNVDAMAAQTNSLVGQDRPQLDTVIQRLTSVLGVVGSHQDDLAQAVSYLSSALKGFASIGYSGSTPLSWANIYVNPLGTTGTAGLLGACGALTTALDQALGPTPLPCDARTGPLPGITPSNASPSPSTNGGVTSQAASAGPTGAAGSGNGGATPLASPNSGIAGLSQLFAPLLGGGG